MSSRKSHNRQNSSLMLANVLDSVEPCKTGEKVCVATQLGMKFGQIAYKGQVKGTEGEWFGIILDTPEGKHNGSFEGKKYFECSPKHGLFSRSKNVTVVGEDDDFKQRVAILSRENQRLRARLSNLTAEVVTLKGDGEAETDPDGLPLVGITWQVTPDGLAVDSVHERPAIRAGIMSGDIIRKINGTPIDGPQTVLKLFAKVRPLDRMDFMLERGGDFVDRIVIVGSKNKKKMTAPIRGGDVTSHDCVGVILKRSDTGIGVWRKRFVSINASSNQMKIFKEQGDKEAAKSINLMNATLQLFPLGGGHEFTFGVRPFKGDHSFLFDVGSQRAMNKWQEHILKAGAIAPSFEGWLYKKGGGINGLKRKNWKKRYFVLVRNVISYYSSTTPNSQVLGVVPLSDATTELGLGETKKVSGREFAFRIYTHIGGKRTWQIYAENDDARQDWLKHINKAIKETKEGDEPTQDMQPLAVDEDEPRPSDLVPMDPPPAAEPAAESEEKVENDDSD